MKKVQPFSIRQALAFGFKSLWNNLGLIIGFCGVVIIVHTLALLIFMPGSRTTVNSVISCFRQYGTGSIACFRVLQPAQRLSMFLIPTMQLIVSSGFYLAAVRMSLQIYETGKSSLHHMLSGFSMLPRFFVTTLVYNCIVLSGTLMFLIPGIVWGIAFNFYMYFIVEKKAGIDTSLRKSYRMARPYVGRLFLFVLALALLNGVLSIIPLLGNIVAMVVSGLAHTFVYKKLQS